MMSAVSAEEETLALEETITMEIPSPGATRASTSQPEPKTPDSASLPAVVSGIDEEDNLAMNTILPPSSSSATEDTWSGALSRLGSAMRSSVSEAARAVSAATSVSAKGVPPRIICVGDEFTANGDKANGGWIALLREKFELKAKIESYGVRGYCANWGSRVLLKALRDERDTKVVLIWFGANDSLLPPATTASTVEDYRLVLAKMAVHCVNEKIIPVFITPPAAIDGIQEGRTSENAEIYADACKSIAREMKVPCIDICSAMEGSVAKYINDKGELSVEGNKLVAKLVLETFETRLRKFAPDNLQPPFVSWMVVNPDDPTDLLGVGL